MHLLMIVIGVGAAWLLRQTWRADPTASWQTRWQQALQGFVLPPLMLLMIAVAVLCMGRQGWMVFGQEGWFYVSVVTVYLGAIALLLGHLAWQSYQMHHHLTTQYPTASHHGQTCRVLDTPIPYSAQIGLGQPELVVSQGLLDVLDAPHLQAVLLHEQAHRHYQDTFWFFWLGWLRRCTGWLPQTEALWQELLLLREMRADCWAARQTDPLLLAEALLTVVRAPAEFPTELCVPFGESEGRDRLIERIDAIIEPIADSSEAVSPYGWLSWGFLPLLLIPLHH